MFDFLKKKNNKTSKIIAPVDGKVIPLSEVPDPVFAEKMAGDGIAINPTSDIILSPVEGIISLIFNTKHAFALKTNDGIEILVHVGIDTVSLNGEGFTQLVETGSTVQVGTPILKIDKELISSKGFSLITPILITNPDNLSSITPIINIDTTAGKTPVIEYSI